MTTAQEAAALVGELMLISEAIEGHTTYATAAALYPAIAALRPVVDGNGKPISTRYLVDEGIVNEATGELIGRGEIVLRLIDLQPVARRKAGGTVPRGWLEGRMAELEGWRRVFLDAHEVAGRDGRTSPHLSVDVYRGPLPFGRPPEELGDKATRPNQTYTRENENALRAHALGMERSGHLVTGSPQVATSRLVTAGDPAAVNVVAGWLGIPVPAVPKHRNRTRASCRKTGAKRPRP